MNVETHSLFDFGLIAKGYDRWYDTPKGRMYDCQEKNAVLELLPRPWANARLLDVGCGTGHWSRFFAEQGYDVVGLDISPEMIEVARSQRIPGCHFEIGDACGLPKGNPAYQVVTSMATLEFVSEPATAVAGMLRCVRHEGSVLVGTLNKLAPINRERIADGKEPYTSAHLFSPSELRALLQPHGRIRMRVTSAIPDGHPRLKALRALRDRVLLRCGKAAGAFIVAEVQT